MIKYFLCVGAVALSLQTAWGFALLGPNTTLPGYSSLATAGYQNAGDPWQTILLGYDMVKYYGTEVAPGGGVWLGDIGGPKNLGEEYRRNVPVLYYAYDDNFSGVTGEGFFGQTGENAVDQAFAIMNGLNSVDSYSSDLHEFPFQSQTFNFQAQNLYLTDIKSVTLHLLVEQLGLTEPERYTWTLHDRHLPAGGVCPQDEEYLVVQRNYDPMPSALTNVQYSAYVNNVLYSYFIEDDCDKHPPDWSAITVPNPQDPQDGVYTAVAANNLAGSMAIQAVNPANTNLYLSYIYIGGLQNGGFYTGLTRDDVGGLRYLMSTNNVNYETPAAGSTLISSTTVGQTNLSPQMLLYTSNYNAFWWAARTNSPATLSNMYPGLIILSSSNTFTTVATPIVISYYTNSFVLGNPPVLVVKTNGYTTNALELYFDKFANVVTNVVTPNGYSPNTSAQLVTVTVSQGGVLGNPLVTNTTTKSVTVANVPSGEFYINTNYLCGPDVMVSPQPAGFPIANVTATTNLIFATSNSAGYFSSQSLVTYSTTHVYVVEQPICTTTVTGGTATNIPEYYQGIGGVKFAKISDGLMDPLTHLLKSPITTRYTNYVFNPATRKFETRIFQRTLTTPDIIISAEDLNNGPADTVFVGTVTRPIPTYEIGNVLPGLSGPGVIDGQTTFTYNKGGTVFWNFAQFTQITGSANFTDLVNPTNQIPALKWASFDYSTNITVYPNGTSIQQIEDALAISVSPTILPDGSNGSAYPTTTFTATGGTAPYAWSLGAGTSLPTGLNFSGGVLSGTLSGNAPGVYDFAIQVTDAQGLNVAMNYTITIH